MSKLESMYEATMKLFLEGSGWSGVVAALSGAGVKVDPEKIVAVEVRLLRNVNTVAARVYLMGGWVAHYLVGPNKDGTSWVKAYVAPACGGE